MMALVDGDYRFILVEVGANGTSSDEQIFEDCGLKEAIEQRVIGFLPSDHLPDDNRDTPYFFVGDDVFPLHTFMMKPYCRLRTNTQLSMELLPKSILANIYACLLSVIKFKPKIATNIVLTDIYCQNLMRMRYPVIQNAALDGEDDNNIVIPGEWRR